MNKIILCFLIISMSAYSIADEKKELSTKNDYQEVLLEVNKVGAEINKNIQGKNIVEKINYLEMLLDKYADNSLLLDFIKQNISFYYSLAGLHQKVLENEYRDWEGKSPPDKLVGYKTKDAVNEILKHAKDHRIVMVNEAHHIAQHRVLTYRLLPKLWEQGYRYFAAEAFGKSAAMELEKGYVSHEVGYYTVESLYANLVLKAKEIGFEIISYDMHKPSKLNTTDERETDSALIIKEKVFDKDPKAKIIIHVGFAHINEETWLASKLKEMTGLETFTIDQTTRTEKINVKYEHSSYTKAVEDTKLKYPFVFVKDDKIWSSGENKSDITAFWPRTIYVDGRPEWASLGRKKYNISSKDCENSYPCIIEVFKFKHKDEVPLDKIVILSPQDNKAVFLSPGKNTLVITNANNKQVEKVVMHNES
ncbi:hypothetical protein [Aliikangiella maris]|uniref:Erythromycin esterase family protein n=2 Tax=Aliikangiella maris TaxID=3162458 RepID=A0ABV2BW76_9GAMM